MSEPQPAPATQPILHPIQLLKAELSGVEFKAFRPSDGTSDIAEFNLSFGRSTFSENNRRIDLVVSVEAGNPKGEDQTPYYLKIEVRGQFRVDEKVTLSTAKVEEWAGRLAPFILLPFLREQVYAFTLRTGFAPLTLPMYQLPSLNLAEIK